MQIGCPQCGKQYQVDPSLAGRQVACKACGERFIIGGEPSVMDSSIDGDQEFMAGDIEITSAPNKSGSRP